MSSNRAWALGLMLLLGLALHWWDPVPRREATDTDSVVHAVPSHGSGPLPVESTGRVSVVPQDQTDWQSSRQSKPPTSNVDLFMTRFAALNLQAQKALAKQKPVPVIQRAPEPPPAPPQEVAPSVNVIGTWGAGADAAVFLGTPAGTVMVKQGSIVMENYKVTRVDTDRLVLVNQQTQHEWPIAVPAAPTSIQTWPMRSAP